MKRPNQLSSFLNCVQTSEKLEGVFQQAEQFISVEADCRQVLPAYFHNCHVVRMADGNLVISCPSQAIVSRIRQQIPFLKDALNRKGWCVSSIRLKVNFELQNQRDEKTPVNRRLPQSAQQCFEQLYDKVSQNKQASPLAEVIARMLAHSKR